MLKDSNIDPVMGNIPTPTAKKAHESFFDNPVPLHESKNSHSRTILNAFHKSPLHKEEGEKGNINSPRSSHKIVTPLRRPTSSFLVANLESLFTDSQGVSEQIAKMTETANSKTNSSYKNKCETLSMSNSMHSLSTFTLDNLSDPNLLQSHVQKSLESSVFGLESPYRRVSTTNSAFITGGSMMTASTNNNNNTSKNNSLYNTPIRCKQSRSYDFSELSSQRSKQRRSSIVVLDDEDLLSSFGGANGPLSDLSHFKDNEESVDLITPEEENGFKREREIMEGAASSSIFDCSSEEIEIDQQKPDISPIELSTPFKRKPSFSTQKRTLTLPSTEEYQDGSKPSFSYASLIAQAIIASPKKRIALSNIYLWIMETYPYYRLQTCGWQNSIRHNLSLNKCFKKIPRDDDEPGKGAYWTVDLDEMDDFEDGMFKRRRNSSGSSNSSCVNSPGINDANSNSFLNSPSSTSSCSSSNAFVNGTGWTPISLNSPKTKSLSINHNEFGTPQQNKSANLKPSSTCYGSVPMTPLTMSMAMNQFEITPQKLKTMKKIETAEVLLTPKISANPLNRSPYSYSSLPIDSKKEASVPSRCKNKNNKSLENLVTSATFWSYPNLSLTQLGLDGEPPLPEGQNNNTIESFYNILNTEPDTSNKPRLPELLQSNRSPVKLELDMESSCSCSSTSSKNEFVRMSPLSWLLSVSSQDSNLVLFDQSQQILSEYLNFKN